MEMDSLFSLPIPMYQTPSKGESNSTSKKDLDSLDIVDILIHPFFFFDNYLPFLKNIKT